MPKGATPFSSASVNVWNSTQENTTTKTESLDGDNYQKAMANIDMELKWKARRTSQKQSRAKSKPTQHIPSHQLQSLHVEEEDQVFEEEFSPAGESYIPPTAMYAPIPSTLNTVGYVTNDGYPLPSTYYQPEHPQSWQQNPAAYSHPEAFRVHAQASSHNSANYNPPQLAIHYSEHPHPTMLYEREYFDHGFSSTSGMESVMQTTITPGLNPQVNDYESFHVPAHPATHIHTFSHDEPNAQYFPVQHESTYMYYQTRY